jgi:lipopolysaccharide/colanic/teichoic acid biosynthesis glycosyltransferase
MTVGPRPGGRSSSHAQQEVRYYNAALRDDLTGWAQLRYPTAHRFTTQENDV